MHLFSQTARAGGARGANGAASAQPPDMACTTVLRPLALLAAGAHPEVTGNAAALPSPHRSNACPACCEASPCALHGGRDRLCRRGAWACFERSSFDTRARQSHRPACQQPTCSRDLSTHECTSAHRMRSHSETAFCAHAVRHPRPAQPCQVRVRVTGSSDCKLAGRLPVCVYSTPVSTCTLDMQR